MLAPTPACRARIAATVLPDAKGPQSAVSLRPLSPSLSVCSFVILRIPPLLRGESHLHRRDLRLRLFHLPLLRSSPPPPSPRVFGPPTIPRRRISNLPPDPFSRAMHHSARRLYRPSMSTKRARGGGRALINADAIPAWIQVRRWRSAKTTWHFWRAEFYRETLNASREPRAAVSRIERPSPAKIRYS